MEEMVRMQTATGTAIAQNSKNWPTVIAGRAGHRQQMIFSNETPPRGGGQKLQRAGLHLR